MKEEVQILNICKVENDSKHINNKLVFVKCYKKSKKGNVEIIQSL